MIAESSIQDWHSHPARLRRRQRVAEWRKAQRARRDAMMLRLRSDQSVTDDESIFRGVIPLHPERKILAVKTFAVNTAKLPRLQPHVVIDPLLLDDDE